MTFRSVAWLTVFVLLPMALAAPLNVPWYGTPEAVGYVGNCNELCCCTVCSSPTNDAFPYGLTNVAVTGNPPFPSVRGSSCHFSIWSDKPYNDTNGRPAVVPNTLFWSNYSVFLDYVNHIAPISCDCCQFSGVHTSCKETIPLATRPTHFYIVGGSAQELQPTTLMFKEGVELNYTDYIEIRNDTLCGYHSPPALIRKTNLTILNVTYNAQVDIAALPEAGCYRVCYFASSLTTPQWYDLGTITVHAAPQPSLAYTLNPRQVVFAGNELTFTFFGRRNLSVFNNIAELRTSGVCGTAGPTTSTALGTNGILEVVNNEEWCKPAVKPKITAQRPWNYIAIKYSDCPSANRVYQSKTQWTLTLPAVSSNVSYTVCYRLEGVWYSLTSLFVPGQYTQATALMALYNSTRGATWKHNNNWGGANPCNYFGVRCDVSGNVVALHLNRNNLSGTIPPGLFLAPYFKTLTHVGLEMNALTGTVPSSIGALRNLNFLDIGFNSISGTMPITLDYTSLYIMYAGNNILTGNLPDAVDNIALSWSSYGNNVADWVEPAGPRGCPVDILECSQRGSTDYGTTQCGIDGVTKEACLAYGCCFNPQAPLVFGGTACFTKRRTTYKEYPPCLKLNCTPVV
jgi:hypothetical protein